MDYDPSPKDGYQCECSLVGYSSENISKIQNNLPNKVLLPVLSNQKMNSYLKEIGDLCGIDKNLTFHAAKHNAFAI